MKRFLVYWLALALTCWAADNKTVAARLARLAGKAESSGQTVRAYMLFAEASVRDPQNTTYRANRDALASAAHLLSKANIETADISNDVLTAQSEAANPVPPIERVSSAEWQLNPALDPLPHVQAAPSRRNFDLHANAKSLVEQVAAAYGIQALCDPDLKPGMAIHFELQDADFRAALEAVTAATHTFVFPISSKAIHFVVDTEPKRDEFEPNVMLTFPLQEALSEKDLIDAANAVRGLLHLRTIGWDSANRTVVIRDHATRARVARAVMESLLLPRAQVSFDVQFLAIDTDKTYHYGATLQTLFQVIDFGKIGVNNILPAALNSTKFLTFGAGATLFGIGVADATAFASYSDSTTSSLFDATVVVGDRQTANFHIGDKYPIASSIYSGFAQGSPSIYNPSPQITLEDLGLVLKLTPHITGEGDVSLDLEADFKSVSTQTLNTIPIIAERQFKGAVDLREGEWAIMAGMDSSSTTFSRSGLAGIGQIPGLKQLLTDTNRETQTSKTLIVIKPTVTRLPMENTTSPAFLIGSRRGERVLI